MAKPYSYDLRRKVIDAIELDGMKRCEASEHFHISRNTINQWFQLKAETGDVNPKVREPTGHCHKITDMGEVPSILFDFVSCVYYIFLLIRSKKT